MRDWYHTGSENVPQSKKRTQRGAGERVFWLKSGQERSIVFVDEEIFGFYQHHLKIDGQWGYYRTCCRDVEGYSECPYCAYSYRLGEKAKEATKIRAKEEAQAAKDRGDEESADRLTRMVSNATDLYPKGYYPPYFVGYYTIIDLSEWTDGEGNLHMDEKKLLPVKLGMANTLKTIKKQLGSLKTRKFLVKRSEEHNAPRSGDLYIPIEPMDMALYGNPDPFDYVKIFKPKSYEEAKQEIAELEGDWEGNAEVSGDEQLPF